MMTRTELEEYVERLQEQIETLKEKILKLEIENDDLKAQLTLAAIHPSRYSKQGQPVLERE